MGVINIRSVSYQLGQRWRIRAAELGLTYAELAAYLLEHDPTDPANGREMRDVAVPESPRVETRRGY